VKRIGTPTLLAVSIALMCGWLVVDSRAQTGSNASPSDLANAFTIDVPEHFAVKSADFSDGTTGVQYANADGSETVQVFSLPFSGPLTTQGVQQQYPWNWIDDFGLPVGWRRTRLQFCQR
jgi:hypothetical protein